MSSPVVHIEKPVYGGAFLARLEGKAVFVPLALPGEKVRIRVLEDKRGYAHAEMEELVAGVAERTAAACRHFGSCGGCNYQHADYAAQLEFKRAILAETLARAGVQASVPIEILSGQPWAYRNRVRLAFDEEGKAGYRGRGSHRVVPLEECPITAPVLVRAALSLAEARSRLGPGPNLAEVSLFCNAEESAVLARGFVPVLRPRDLDSLAGTWSARVPELCGIELVAASPAGNKPAGIARWGRNWLEYLADGFAYRVDSGCFFQVNRWLIDALVERVAAGLGGRLAWDLYAGVGLFARRLTANFAKVVAVESERAATAALKTNLRERNAEVVTADTLDFLRRRPADLRPDLVIVDPPRTGLGASTVAWLAEIAPPAMVYVSCDPATLARDLRALGAAGYVIASLTLADLFPQTFHIESIVHLARG